MAAKSTLTPEEKALFRTEMGNTRPLSSDTVMPARTAATITRPLHSATDNRSFSLSQPDDTITADSYLSYQGPGIQYKTFQKLRQGKVHLEAELDLHGLNTEQAAQHVDRFLSDCQQQLIRYISIIHGKGWRSQDNKPILKQYIVNWLRHNPSVLAFCSAPSDQGGTGAVYILLKRQPID